MPYLCEALVKKLWHATPAMRPQFPEAVASLEAVLENLPGLGSSMRRCMHMRTCIVDAMCMRLEDHTHGTCLSEI